MTDTEIQKSILNKLMFLDGARYRDLHNAFENHDLFNYHLRELQNKGYIEKNEQRYVLTQKGKQTVSFMEEDGMYQKQFKVGMFIDIIRTEGKIHEMLLHKRLKHPHYGYIGAVTGKLHWGESLEDNLQRELKEEVGIEAKSYTTIGVVRDIFKDDKGEKVGDGIFFVIAVTDWTGKVLHKSEEGEYFWHDIDKILDLDKIFRSGFEKGLPHLKRFLKNPNKYTPYIYENGTEGGY